MFTAETEVVPKRKRFVMYTSHCRYFQSSFSFIQPTDLEKELACPHGCEQSNMKPVDGSKRFPANAKPHWHISGASSASLGIKEEKKKSGLAPGAVAQSPLGWFVLQHLGCHFSDIIHQKDKGGWVKTCKWLVLCQSSVMRRVNCCEEF